MESVIDHNGRDKNCLIFKHSFKMKHRSPSLQKFSILGGNYFQNKFCGNVAVITQKNDQHLIHKKSLYRLNFLIEVFNSFENLNDFMYCNYENKHFGVFIVCFF